MEDKYDVERFLNEIIDVCKKYNISISHEDSQGAFILVPYDEYYTDWIKECSVKVNGKHFSSIENYLKNEDIKTQFFKKICKKGNIDNG